MFMTRALPEHAVGATLVKLSCNRGVTGCNPGAHVCNFVATKARLGATLVRHGRNLRQKPGVTCVWPGRYLGAIWCDPGCTWVLHTGAVPNGTKALSPSVARPGKQCISNRTCFRALPSKLWRRPRADRDNRPDLRHHGQPGAAKKPEGPHPPAARDTLCSSSRARVGLQPAGQPPRRTCRGRSKRQRPRGCAATGARPVRSHCQEGRTVITPRSTRASREGTAELCREAPDPSSAKRARR